MNVYDFLATTMRAAGAELMRRQGAGLKTMMKPDTSLVTEADLASEKLLHENITKYFPDDTILSEESGQTTRGSSYVWIVDPLDGTTNYANGYPFFCISVGRGRYLPNGRIQMEQGAVYDPNRERLYFAELGKGAHVNGKPLKVAAPRDFAKCFLVTGFYYMRDDTLQHEIDRFSRVAQKCQTIRRDGAAALDLAYVSEGVYDAFWEVGLAPWDVAAGSLLVAEAGGAVQNYGANPSAYDVMGHGIIAGNPATVASIAALL
jgi:myo-inositol-1(or 4)-monophosphatase